MDVELRHARLVAAIASARSISKAAALLNMPQPAVSTQLRRIEKELGGDVFVRSRVGVVPTALGERLIPMLVDLARRGDALLAEAAAQTTDSLIIGNVDWTAPTLREAITACLPTSDVQTETVDPVEALEAVREGRLNLALVPNVPPGPVNEAGKVPLSTAVVVREPIWLALPIGHRLSGPDPVDPVQSRSLEWVRYARGHWFHDMETEAFADLVGDHPVTGHRARGHHEAMSWVRDAGVAALTTPTGATRDVQLVPVAEPRTCELLLVWRSEAISRTLLRKLLESVRRYYCAYARTIPRYWSWMADHPEHFREVGQFLSGDAQPPPAVREGVPVPRQLAVSHLSGRCLNIVRMTTAATNVERRARIKDIICDILEIDPAEMTDSSRFKEDHEADSMGAIEILSTLERTFGVDIDQSELARMVNLDAVVAVVDEALASK